MRPIERHAVSRVGWLRAAVLGANDGLISTAGLLVGVAAGDASRSGLVITGLVAMAGGALAMASGEYSSVSSQRDAELADLAKERRELELTPEAELHELIQIYRRRGLSPDLARQVAVEMTKTDALTAHARDELGLDLDELAKPVEAAAVSALSFTAGASVPFLAIVAMPSEVRLMVTYAVVMVALGLLGAVGARLGGAPVAKAATRVLAGGAITMAVTTVIGHLVGVAV